MMCCIRRSTTPRSGIGAIVGIQVRVVFSDLRRRRAVGMKALWQLAKETFAEWSGDKVPRLAAALSYYSLFSLAPVLIIVIAVAGLAFGHDAAQGRVVQEFEGLIGSEGARAIQSIIEKTSSMK